MKRIFLSLALVATCGAAVADNFIRVPLPNLKGSVVTSHPATASLPATTAPTAPAEPAGLLLSTSQLDFGIVSVGSLSSSATVTVKNQGKDAVELTPLAGLNDAFRTTSNSCVGVLAGGAQCAFGINFQPSAAGQNQFASISIGGKSVELRGSAKLAAHGKLEATQQWNVGTSVALGKSLQTNLIFKNIGTAPVVLGASSVEAGEWALNTTVSTALRNQCVNKTLAVGATCRVMLLFKPTAVGSHVRMSSFRIPNDATDEYGVASAQDQGLSFNGTVTPANTASLYIEGGSTNPTAPASYVYAKGSSNILAIELQNKGDRDLVISDTAMTSSYSQAPTPSQSCKITMTSTQYCSIHFTLPDMPIGIHTLTLRVGNDGYSGPTTTYYFRVEIK